MKISKDPPKGTKDWFPEEYKVRKYIFDTWRRVCTNFGYEEYLTPIFEDADIYRAKSGEDIGGKELMTMTDKAGRELAIRPEMTPSVTRMVTRKYTELSKPIRYFSIANFVRNEKPQRGRNREFWQLNADVFGIKSINADIEILQLALEIMLSFSPPKGAFQLNLNNRKIIDTILDSIVKVTKENKQDVVRLMDKFEKLTNDEFSKSLKDVGLIPEQIVKIELFLKSTDAEKLQENFPELSSNEGLLETLKIVETLTKLGYTEWLNFDPSIIRGFDYYDGIIFEVFDNNPDNNRSLFGGGRYNGLANLFVDFDMPATGFAPGDETLKLFLESWNLIPESLFSNKKVYMPLLDEKLLNTSLEIAQELRRNKVVIESGLEKDSFSKALKYSNDNGYNYVIILGEDEAAQNKVTLKTMDSGKQELLSVQELVEKLNV
jgi:histidyl-tRNA synthetase